MPYILVIDDDEQMNAMLCQMLTEAGHHPLSAANGREAVRLLEKHDVKLVVTDILMPDMDGVELILKMRFQKTAPAIIAISGGGRYHDAKACLAWAQNMGIKNTFAKPINRTKFLAKVKQLMKE
jgi:DNA-binding response OmpR family regulator